MDPSRIEALVLEAVRSASRTLAPAELRRCLPPGTRVSAAELRAALRELVAAGRLVYRERLGRTVVEPSFEGPVRVGRGLVLKPAHRRFRPAPGDTTVELQSGAAFGYGEHPTTRLALRGIEAAARDFGALATVSSDGGVLDIGTGSGVLVIAAVRLGWPWGIGVDSDACARAEARENVRLNRLDDRVRIHARPVEETAGRFALTAANLRWPTLKGLAPVVSRIAAPGGFLVVSGVRPGEAADLAALYRRAGFTALWADEEAGWAGAVYRHAAE